MGRMEGHFAGISWNQAFWQPHGGGFYVERIGMGNKEGES